MAKPMTQARLAEKLGLSQQQVSKLTRQGMPSDLAGARRWRREHLDPVRGGKGGSPAAGTLHELRRRKLHAEARLLERKADLAPTGTLRRDAIEAALFALFNELRMTLDAWHPRVLEALDPVCGARDPRYPDLYRETFRAGRETWADSWVAVVRSFVGPCPELREWFEAHAARERGRTPADA